MAASFVVLLGARPSVRALPLRAVTVVTFRGTCYFMYWINTNGYTRFFQQKVAVVCALFDVYYTVGASS